MIDHAADIRAMISDMGVDVTLGAVTFTALYQDPDVEVLAGDGAQQFQRRRSIIFATDDSPPGLEVGATLTVAGDTFTVRQILKFDDGETVEVILAEAH